MEQAQLNKWKDLLNRIEAEDYKVVPGDLQELDHLLRHLPEKTAHMLFKLYRECTIKSRNIFAILFDRIDLSDKSLLCQFLTMLNSYGFFRLAQITHHIPGPVHSDIFEPPIEKMRWYELRPLLPEAGTIGWKGIMNIGLIREEPKLSKICVRLIEQKLQFFSILLTLPHYYPHYDMIRSNGRKVAKKLLEMINDSAFVDEALINPGARLVDLLNHYIDEDQQETLLAALVQDLFKPHLVCQSLGERELELIDIIKSLLMDRGRPQSIVYSKLLEHLRCNIIRRKRRHSVETSLSEEEPALEKFLLEVEQSPDIKRILSSIGDFRVSTKKFQTKYLHYWLEVVSKIQDGVAIATSNSVKVIGSCSVILVSAEPALNPDLIGTLYNLMIQSIERSTQFGNDHLFNRCDPEFMIEFTQLTSALDSETIEKNSSYRFYRSIIRRYIRACIAKSAKQEGAKFHSFAQFICGENLDRDTSQQLQCICVQELASALSDPKLKASGAICEVLRCSSQICCEKLLKYIKKYACLKCEGIETDDAENPSHQEQESTKKSRKKEAAIETLLSVLKLAFARDDKDLIDSYSSPLLRIFELTKYRIWELAGLSRDGKSRKLSPLDRNLPQIVALYLSHKDTIQGYLSENFLTEISSTILDELVVNHDKSISKQHKGIYNQLKSDLNNLNERASKSDQFYHTLINRQFNSIELNIKNGHSIEEVCCKDMREQISIIGDICDKIIMNCDLKIYRKMIHKLVNHFECCDPLDHPRFVYLSVILEALIPRHEDSSKKVEIFDENLSNLCCCLMKITKSVQYGPSIYAFTKSGGHNTNISIQCCTYILCLRIYTTLFRRYTPKLAQEMIGDILQICVSANLVHYAKHCSSLHRLFTQLCAAISGLLRSISKKQNLLQASLTIFLTVFEHLMRCLIMAADRQKLDKLYAPSNVSNNLDQNNNISDERAIYESRLEDLAIDIGRTLNNISSLRVKMVDFAPHLVSSFVQNIQKASCPEFIKLHLSEGMFRIFNLIDAHQKERHEGVLEAGIQRKTTAGRASGSLFEMIHARLDQASREVFRDLHDNYNRFHKYQAKF